MKKLLLTLFLFSPLYPMRMGEISESEGSDSEDESKQSASAAIDAEENARYITPSASPTKSSRRLQKHSSDEQSILKDIEQHLKTAKEDIKHGGAAAYEKIEIRRISDFFSTTNAKKRRRFDELMKQYDKLF